MTEHFITLEGALPADTTLVGLRGREALSTPFAFDLFVVSADGDALDGMLGSQLTVHFAAEPAYELSGVVLEVEILREVTERTLARLRLGPRLQLLGLSKHSRMFTEISVPDAISAVLEEAGLTGDDFELRLQQSYQPEEHICQYKESDLAFVQRWMQHEGLYYFFEHADGAHKLVICDTVAGHDSLAPGPLRYHPQGGGDSSAAASFERFRCTRQARASKVMLADYDYANPSLAVAGEADADEHGFAELSLHGERFFTPDKGAQLANVRAQAELASQRVFSGRGMLFHLRSGYGFELSEHAVGWMNRAYLCVEVEHHANLSARTEELAALTGLKVDDSYRVEVTAIASDTEYKPPRRTPKPRVSGFEAGVIDGPADSDYAQLDDQGRYRVIMHFDESGLDAGKASTAVRMMQPHGGNPEGWHFPLRKGTEVMIAFVGGDPDRPIIAGAVPNAVTPSVVTSANHSRNIIHTGGDNHIELEDLDGGQWIDVKTPTEDSYLHLGEPYNPTHNFVLKTDGNALFNIGSNQDINVGGKLDETVDGALTETYKASQLSNVTGPQKTTATGGCKETYKSIQLTLAAGDVTELYNGVQDTMVEGGMRNEIFGATQDTHVSGGLTEQQYVGIHHRKVLGGTTEQHSMLTRHCTGVTSQTYSSTVRRTWGPVTSEFASLDWTVDGDMTTTCPTLDIIVPGDNLSWINDLLITLLKLEMSFLAAGTCGNKFEVTGLAVGHVSGKVEGGGLINNLVGTELSVNLVKAKSRILSKDLTIKVVT